MNKDKEMKKRERYDIYEEVLARYENITDENWEDVINEIAFEIVDEDFDTKIYDEAVKFIKKSGKC